ncbi:MAG: T9SS type A sorting domain-containing protein [Bacteroidota bacterium]
MRIKFVIILIFFIAFTTKAQYPPAAGTTGSTAISKDSPDIIDWATTCSIVRGYLDIADTNAEDPAAIGNHYASFGSNTDALGVADNATVSLGDGGEAILTFNHPIVNGQGFDFAVFENSFDGLFLELAFVSVSTDGIHYVTFPSVSLTQDTIQVAGFETLDATKINNLAGKYKVLYGTPFDLEELKDSVGLDVNNINYIKITDVVGNISEKYCRKDSQGHIINDPYPTPFMTGGFDLDAVGVMHNTSNTGINASNINTQINTFPNPFVDKLNINFEGISMLNSELSIYNSTGALLINQKITYNIQLNTTSLAKGMYLIKISLENGDNIYKKVIKY